MTSRLLLASFVGSLSLVAACGDGGTKMGDDDPGTDDAGPGSDGGPQVNACTTTINAKKTQFATQLETASPADPAQMIDTTGDQAADNFGGNYRDNLAVHPGCLARAAYTANGSEPFVTDNEATVTPGAPAAIPGYTCAAKEYTATTAVDTAKPIVILVHGNSSGVTSWEEYFRASLAGTTRQTTSMFSFTVESAVREQLATKLVNAGYKVYAFDARTDRVAALTGWSSATNPFLNMDHGWGTPLLQSMIKNVMKANPGRKVSLVGHSLGVTNIRDALRRLYLEHKAGVAGSINPFPQVKDAILLSGANHGVVGGSACDANSTNMRITVICEMGDRETNAPTYFSSANNGPGDIWSTPCADGDYAFGDSDACEGNVVQYTTVTMEDLPDGKYQDEFVSEATSSLDMPNCVDNVKIGLDAYDASAYFITGNGGFLASHFGSARANAGMTIILDKLAD